ncbi:MAG: DUF2490 domain-containing protein [Myxococcota bacterium]
MRRFAPLLALLLLSTSTRAEGLDPQAGAWFGVFAAGPLHGDVMAWFDVHARANQDFSGVNYLVRPGVGWRFRPDMVAWLGYAWTPQTQGGAITLDEHRVWQQWTWDGPRFESGVRLSLRSRLEQRFANGEVGLRFRQFVRVQSPFLGGGPVLLAAWDEAFVAFNDTSFQAAGFDQNRLFLGVGTKVGSVARVEAGYFNNWLSRPGADPFRHVVMVNVFFSW